MREAGVLQVTVMAVAPREPCAPATFARPSRTLSPRVFARPRAGARGRRSLGRPHAPLILLLPGLHCAGDAVLRRILPPKVAGRRVRKRGRCLPHLTVELLVRTTGPATLVTAPSVLSYAAAGVAAGAALTCRARRFWTIATAPPLVSRPCTTSGAGLCRRRPTRAAPAPPAPFGAERSRSCTAWPGAVLTLTCATYPYLPCSASAPPRRHRSLVRGGVAQPMRGPWQTPARDMLLQPCPGDQQGFARRAVHAERLRGRLAAAIRLLQPGDLHPVSGLARPRRSAGQASPWCWSASPRIPALEAAVRGGLPTIAPRRERRAG